MVEPLLSGRPATFPLVASANGGEYFLLGYGSEAVVCWTDPYYPTFSMLNCDKAPPQEQIDDYQAWLQSIVEEDNSI